MPKVALPIALMTLGIILRIIGFLMFTLMPVCTTIYLLNTFEEKMIIGVLARAFGFLTSLGLFGWLGTWIVKKGTLVFEVGKSHRNKQ